MSRWRLLAATSLAMIAFAGNSLLCRLALKQTQIDAATFTSIRLVSGAVMLWIIVYARDRTLTIKGSVPSALALFAYAVCFSFAYVQLSAATGALLLFGSVQATMIGYGVRNGERLRALSVAGVAAAFAGFVLLILPGVAAPPLLGTALMITAGIAWGIYSLRGRKIAGDPTRVTAGNFLLCVPMAIVLSLCALPWLSIDGPGIFYAMASGALTSGVGYAIWYAALPGLQATQAAIVQLSVPPIAAAGGVLLLGETMTMRLAIAALAILGGIALVIAEKSRAA
ncbi:MAG: DMT family transporter [Rudaea sp.]